MQKRIAVGIVVAVVIALISFAIATNLKQKTTSEKTDRKTSQISPTTRKPSSVENSPEEKPKKPIENELAGVKLGESLEEVLENKGEPKEKKEQDSNTELKYDGFIVSLESNIVIKIMITGTNISTPRGLKLDDELDRFMELYGPGDYMTQIGDDSSGQYFSHYTMDEWELVIQTCEEGFVWGIWIEKKKEN